MAKGAKLIRASSIVFLIMAIISGISVAFTFMVPTNMLTPNQSQQSQTINLILNIACLVVYLASTIFGMIFKENTGKANTLLVVGVSTLIIQVIFTIWCVVSMAAVVISATQIAILVICLLTCLLYILGAFLNLKSNPAGKRHRQG